ATVLGGMVATGSGVSGTASCSATGSSASTVMAAVWSSVLCVASGSTRSTTTSGSVSTGMGSGSSVICGSSDGGVRVGSTGS
ncbi:MAG TPA: hypothetical protein DFI00_02185, partial [Rhodospirillaceae bacterium]|nr:hypothetical protein [Rhodospirillaceae bacterium]